MTPALLSLLTFLAVLLATVSVWSIFSDLVLKDRSRLKERLDDEFHREQRQRVQSSSLFKDLHKLAAAPADEPVERDRSLRGRLDRMLQQAGLDLSVGRLLLYVLAVAGGLALLVGSLRGSLLLGAVAGVIGGPIPLLYVNFKRRKRVESLCGQLPEAYDLMARALRSGQTVSQTMQGVADEFPQPIAGEFSFCCEQQNLGLPTDIALRDLSRRTGLLEIDIFVVAVLVQRQVGGNLAEMLEKLAHVVRERFRTRGAIRTLTAEGRLQAGVLMGLPPLMFLAMLIVNRSYAQALLEHPALLIGVLVSMGIGALWIRRIINFNY